MKAKIILAIVWTSLCVCERQRRSTVLTDESKRIIEHFDFSNFDKQEALNYIDRQRYENQIRGKRSHTKLKKDFNGKRDPNISADDNLQIDNLSEKLTIPISQKTETQHKQYFFQFPTYECEKEKIPTLRHKRGHRSKKKHRSKSRRKENESEEKKQRKNRKKKKKRHYWNDWTEWSPCSVTCGRGRKIRWRKCIVKNCTTGELEMGEKTCQLPACNLFTKLLGL